ncbi:hypothetical protein A2635_01675 [Candidatus Peribacteria bacterium RIFCSPHIGHO2_01_FULL_51_9]|nr:MAG: hypothetical protein A2635_01675 [Candidatus Peribacteria bacterium RIFCSPHIGHO2_01_FULL_51_9]
MFDRPDSTSECSPEELLERINEALEQLGSTARYKKIPDASPGCESLKGKRITMVDDSKNVLEGFIPELMVATGGLASLIYQQKQTVNELVEEALATSSDAILMDYMLRGFYGDTVVRKLKEKNPSLLCIGFSSTEKRAFERIGVPAVRKNVLDMQGSLQDIARIMKAAS